LSSVQAPTIAEPKGLLVMTINRFDVRAQDTSIVVPGVVERLKVTTGRPFESTNETAERED
jgi:hypothetical protein